MAGTYWLQTHLSRLEKWIGGKSQFSFRFGGQEGEDGAVRTNGRGYKLEKEEEEERIGGRIRRTSRWRRRIMNNKTMKKENEEGRGEKRG